jgi:hypothetical protein
MALVLGLIGVAGALGSCCCCLFFVPGLCAPVAWSLGRKELAEIRAGRSPYTGEGNAKAGMILGMVGTGLLAVYVLFIVGYILLVGFAGALEALKGGGVPKIPR